MLNKLYATKYEGEFGWELFCWQAYLREISKNYEQTIVCCDPQKALLYKDFATLNLENKDCVVLDSSRKIFRYSINHIAEYKSIKQNFISFKTQSNYDIDFLFATRNIKNNHYRNYSLSNWKILRKLLSDYKCASIGTKNNLHIPGTVDLRNISLEELAKVYSNAKAVIGHSSGLMHFGALCETPQIVWWKEPILNQKKLNYYRHHFDWNPFKSKVMVVSDDSIPEPKLIYKECIKI